MDRWKLESVKKRKREWFIKNKERIYEKSRQYRKEHKEELNEYYRNYYHKHKEKLLERIKEWRKKNPEKHKEHKRRTRERRTELQKEKDRIRKLAQQCFRDKMLKRDNYTCQGEGSHKGKLEMHELKYERPIKLSNLQTLCHKHHMKAHRRKQDARIQTNKENQPQSVS